MQLSWLHITNFGNWHWPQQVALVAQCSVLFISHVDDMILIIMMDYWHNRLYGIEMIMILMREYLHISRWCWRESWLNIDFSAIQVKHHWLLWAHLRRSGERLNLGEFRFSKEIIFEFRLQHNHHNHFQSFSSFSGSRGSGQPSPDHYWRDEF